MPQSQCPLLRLGTTWLIPDVGSLIFLTPKSDRELFIVPLLKAERRGGPVLPTVCCVMGTQVIVPRQGATMSESGCLQPSILTHCVCRLGLGRWTVGCGSLSPTWSGWLPSGQAIGFLELSWTTGCSPYHYLFSGSRDGGLQEKGCGWLLGGHLVSSPGHSRRLGGVEGED